MDHFPSLFGGNEFLKEFPYFLPCFVSSLGSLVGFGLGYFYLEESNAQVVARKKREAQGEQQALLHSTGSDNATYTNVQDTEDIKHEQPGLSMITRTSYFAILGYGQV